MSGRNVNELSRSWDIGRKLKVKKTRHVMHSSYSLSFFLFFFSLSDLGSRHLELTRLAKSRLSLPPSVSLSLLPVVSVKT